ncbi:UDP-N-acetylmuramoyl-L-alanine--D-glutamate ligase [Patescibacteria group bacterium]|nr:MAG: UDP-N-acetylmuramoyl-L-alanine--D-glutamate ligase [Patescibacteria group bacterium]
MTISELKQKGNIHVVGASSAEGSAILDFLINQGIVGVTAHDFKSKPGFEESYNSFHDYLSPKEKKAQFQKLTRAPIKFDFKDQYLDGIENADLIFVTQAWFRYAPNFPKLKEAKEKGIPFSSITKLYFALFPGKIIAITGSSGKTTTSNLIAEIVKKSKFKSYFTGNDRLQKPVLNEIVNAKKDEVLIIEVSNRQLMLDLGKNPQIGVITNLSPNHLDDHGTFENYIKAKRSLLDYQTKGDFAILNYDNKHTREIGENGSLKSEPIYFSRTRDLEKGIFVRKNQIVTKLNKEHDICSTFDLQIKGPHNIENALAAVAATLVLDIEPQIIAKALKEFKGVRSRLEFVKKIGGVKFYEDSSACNPDGPRYAVQSFKKPIVLIAGGYRKNPIKGEFDEMAKAVLNNNVKAVILIGEMRDFICNAINKQVEKIKKSVLVHKVDSLEEAVHKSLRISDKGDVVVMSPGCESFGMFKDYRERAERFKELVNELSVNS